MDIRTLLKTQTVLLDGAMGTMLQREPCFKTGDCPEALNLTHPEVITSIHKKYIEAGAQIIYTNTFGANRLKLPAEYPLERVIAAAFEAAKAAVKETDCLIAYDMGPLGALLEPTGTIGFEQAYSLFSEQVRAAAENGADLLVIETIADLYEMKAAVLAAKEHSELPIIASMTFESSMRTFMGCCIPSMAVTLEGLGVDAVGINCSLSPETLIPHAEELLKYTNLPVIVKANAGLPSDDGSFDTGVAAYTEAYRRLTELGVSIIGGCCGTDPDYIRSLSRFSRKARPAANIAIPSAVCTPSKYVEITSPKIIGERLNPTGKKALKEALLGGGDEYIISQAKEQAAAGADILDINCGLPQLDEALVMPRLIKLIQAYTDLPLQIDSSNPEAVERALRLYNGKPIVNSVNGDDEVLDAVLPAVKKYGAAVVALTLDKDGIPRTLKKRKEIAARILRKAEALGIKKSDVFIDPLTLTVSAEPEQVKITLDAIKYFSTEMRMNTVLGISNISFGLPNRTLINSAFLQAALNCGLTLPIMNPNIKENMDAVRAYRVLSGLDAGCAEYIAAYGGNSYAAAQDDNKSIEFYILNGLKKECGEEAARLLTLHEPLEVVNAYLIPALDKVGALYESGKLFLPQLIMCAETAKRGFDEVNKALADTGAGIKKHTVLLATVQGDIHDIGKNIVKVVLENYGYNIVDLGKNVGIGDVVDAIKRHGARLAGLSALMTTTAVNMEKTVAAIREQGLNCKIMVGGAVITEGFAKKIGADYYAKDANEAVRIAKSVFGASD